MLLLSLLTLFAGPVLFEWLSRSGPVARTLDRVIVGVLIVLVVVLLVPDIVGPLGLAAPGYLLLGYLLPGLLEQLVRRAAETLHLLSLGVALVGLLLIRAPNVRAAMREAEQMAARGVLSAPSSM